MLRNVKNYNSPNVKMFMRKWEIIDMNHAHVSGAWPELFRGEEEFKLFCINGNF